MADSKFDLIEEFNSEDIMSINHSRLIHRLCVLLESFADQFDILPELELELLSKKIKPDISIYPNLKVDWLNDIIFFDQAPLSVIEILSPKQALTDLTDKIQEVYFPSGVKSAWIVVPPLKTVHIFMPEQDMLTFTQGLIKDQALDIEIAFSEVFK